MKGRNVSMDIKKGLRNSIVVPTITYAAETWTWNEDTSVENSCSGNELSEGNMWRNKVGWGKK